MYFFIFIFQKLEIQRHVSFSIINFLVNYFWLCWVFIAVWAFLYLQQAGHTLWLRCTGFSSWCFSCCRAQARTGSRARASVVAAPRLQSTGSVVVGCGLSCSLAYGIFPDQGSNPCLPHWQVDSLPLSHQGNPETCLSKRQICLYSKVIYLKVFPSPPPRFVYNSE